MNTTTPCPPSFCPLSIRCASRWDTLRDRIRETACIPHVFRMYSACIPHVFLTYRARFALVHTGGVGLGEGAWLGSHACGCPQRCVRQEVWQAPRARCRGLGPLRRLPERVCTRIPGHAVRAVLAAHCTEAARGPLLQDDVGALPGGRGARTCHSSCHVPSDERPAHPRDRSPVGRVGPPDGYVLDSQLRGPMGHLVYRLVRRAAVHAQQQHSGSVAPRAAEVAHPGHVPREHRARLQGYSSPGDKSVHTLPSHPPFTPSLHTLCSSWRWTVCCALPA